MDDLRSRLVNRVQLTTDGHKAYLEAIEGAFGGDIDYAMLIKLYGAAPETAKGRYSPADCIGSRKMPIEDNPDPQHISTSYAERANLHNADAHAPLHPVDQRLFKEGREPRAFDGPVHGLLQFRPHPQDAARYPAMAAGVSNDFGRCPILWRYWKRLSRSPANAALTKKRAPQAP